MLNLIRQLRRDLLAKNKLKVYLLYGLGEIVLVVVGILLALQIDNWNEDRKESVELKNYLQNISNNIASDSVQLEDMLAFRDSIRIYSTNIVKAANQDYISAQDFSLLTNNKYNIFYDRYLAINQNGFEALKNSGYIGKIQNTKIESLLNQYYLMVEVTINQEKSLNNFIESMEVLGFEQNVFPQMIKILQEPQMDHYFKTNQDHIKELMNHPAILGANFRGSISTELGRQYLDLIALGEESRREIERMLIK